MFLITFLASSGNLSVVMLKISTDNKLLEHAVITTLGLEKMS